MAISSGVNYNWRSIYANIGNVALELILRKAFMYIGTIKAGLATKFYIIESDILYFPLYLTGIINLLSFE
jgi:hypothetical protein